MEVISGKQYVVEGDIRFGTKWNKLMWEYDSVFGPVFTSQIQRARLCDNGVTGFVRRITNSRESNKELHDVLMNNQYAWLERFDSQIEHWLRHYRYVLKCLIPPDGDSWHWTVKWCEEPHPKRQQRMGWLAENTALRLDKPGGSGIEPREVQYVGKPNETLAKGKYLRGIGDLGVNASAKCAYFFPWAKQAFEVPYVYRGCSAQFVKVPTKEALNRVFRELRECSSPVVFKFFSDDSVIAVRCIDGVFCANMDVSACDGSNFNPIFSTLERGMCVDDRFNDDIHCMFDQLLKPCVVSSTVDKRLKVRLRPRYMTLYSGSASTTSVNNMAQIAMFFPMVDNVLAQPLYMRDVAYVLEQSAAEAGFLIKVQQCTYHEDVQFLKHSPVKGVDGEWYPALNLGVTLRNFGRCVGDLPGKAKLGMDLRADMYNSDVVKSYVHAGNSSFHALFREKFIISQEHKSRNRHYVDATRVRSEMYGAELSDESLLLRYRALPSEYQEFMNILKEAPRASAISCPFVDKVMSVDYGYERVCAE